MVGRRFFEWVGIAFVANVVLSLCFVGSAAIGIASLVGIPILPFWPLFVFIFITAAILEIMVAIFAHAVG